MNGIKKFSKTKEPCNNIKAQSKNLPIKKNGKTIIQKSLSRSKSKNKKLPNHGDIKKNNSKPKQIQKKSDTLLDKISSFYSSIINIDNIFEDFQKTILLNKNIIINDKNFEIKTQNEESSLMLSSEKFWIVYIDYLLQMDKIKNREQFIHISNFAFSHLEKDYFLLKSFYLKKIKNFNFTEKNSNTTDEEYLNLLDQNVKILLNSKLKNQLSSKTKNEKEVNEKAENFSFSQNKNKKEEMLNQIVEIKEEKKEPLNTNIIHYNILSLTGSKKNIVNTNPANDETRDKVDETIFKSSMKEKNNKNSVTPFKTASKRKYSDEPYPDDIVEGSIQKFNQSFKKEDQIQPINYEQ